MPLSKRPARRRATTTVQLALAALLALACEGDAPLVPPTPEPPGSDPAPRSLGLMEVSFTLGEAAGPSGGLASASAAGASALGSGSLPVQATASAIDTILAGVQLEPLRTGSFTDGARGNGGVRYFYATFRVRNAAEDGTPYPDARTNLTFVPVSTGGTATPFSKLERFDGSTVTSGAAGIRPTGAVYQNSIGQVASAYPDVLQLFTETEVEEGVLLEPGPTDPFPYGFVTRRADGATNTRTLPANPASGQFDGVVTFAYKVPLQATPEDDLFRVSIMVQAVDDSTTRITQSLEEQDAEATSAFEARAAALGAAVATTLPALSPSAASTRCIAQVRTAGDAGAATDSLVDYDAFADYADLVVLLPGESLDACEADHKSGSPAGQTAGGAFPVEVVAVDARGFVVDSVAHPVALSTSDAHGLVALPAAANLVNGRATLSGVTLITTGTPDDDLPTLTAADQAPGGPVTGAQPVPLTPAAGDPATVIVTADRTYQGPDGTVALTATFQDIYGNAGWNRAVAFTSTLGAVTAATDNGDGSYAATLTMPATADYQQADTAKAGATVDAAEAADSAGVYLFAWKQVSAGPESEQTCGVATDGTAYCWGRNDVGQLGDGTTDQRTTPTPVSGGSGFARVSAGARRTCGVAGSGTAYCWGMSSSPTTLGDGVTDSSAVPVQVANVTDFTQMSVGLTHICGATTGGTAHCWGFNFVGALGNGGVGAPLVPSQVANVTDFTQVSAGREYACGATAGGTAYCWGKDDFDRLGDGPATTGSNVPVQVANVTGFTQVSAAAGHTCGLTADGTAYCWGANLFGILGNGTTDPSDVPAQVSNVTDFAQVTTGLQHTCGVTTSGIAYCWGDNTQGQLGDGSTTEHHLPTQVSSVTGFAQITGGSDYTCGLTTGGIAYCWGDNSSGQLGNGTTTPSTVPVRVDVP